MKKIIIKVLNELKSENPKLDYIRGLLEAIAEEEESEKVVYPIFSKPEIIDAEGKRDVDLNDPIAKMEKEFEIMKNLPNL